MVFFSISTKRNMNCKKQDDHVCNSDFNFLPFTAVFSYHHLKLSSILGPGQDFV